MIKELAIIFIGGGFGSALRYGSQIIINNFAPSQLPHFPWATLAINIAGSFLIGLFYAISARFHIPADIRLLLTTGLCGGFTTFSTFSHEGLELMQNGRITEFALYVTASIALGIAATFAGSWCCRTIL